MSINCSNNQIDSLDVSKGMIRNLNISNCTNLRNLDTAIDSLDVSDCTSLCNLNCRDVESLNVNNCINLQTLTGSTIYLDTLDLSSCISLQTLNFRYGGSLKLLNVSGCKNLQDLRISNNHLDSLDLSNCKNLEYLDCSGNQLTSLNIRNCTQLSMLYCGNNKLNTLDVSSCKNRLYYFTCDNNQLNKLDLSGSLLFFLSCVNNQLDSLNLSGCYVLSDLYCDNNQLTLLDVSGCSSLSAFTCSNNQLTSLDVSHCFYYMNYLACFNNKLISLNVSDCTNLKYLFCQNNQLSDSNLPELYGLPIEPSYMDSIWNSDYGYFDLRGNKGFTESAIRKLADSLPNITYDQILYDKLPEDSVKNEYKLTDYLTLYYDKCDTISLSPAEFNFSDNLNINHLLYFDSQINVEQLNSNNAIITLGGGMYALSPDGERMNGENALHYTATDASLNMIWSDEMTPIIAPFQIAGMAINIGNIGFDNSGANDWISLDFSLFDPPFPAKNIWDTYIKNQRELGIYTPIPSKLKGDIIYSLSAGRKYAFDVDIDNFKIPGMNFGLDSLSFSYHPELDEYAGAVALAIGLSKATDNQLHLEFGFKLKNDIFGLNGAESGLKIPIPETPLMITKVAYDIEFNKYTPTDYLAFGASVDIAPDTKIVTDQVKWLGPIIEGKDIGFLLSTPPIALKLSGKIELFSMEIANAEILYGGTNNLWTMNGNLNAMDIYVGALNSGMNLNRIYGQAYGYVQAPKWLTQYDLLSSLSGHKFSSISADLYVNFSNLNSYLDFELAPAILFGKKISCANVCTNETGNNWYWGKNLKELGIDVSSLKSSNSNINFYLADGNASAIFLTMWGVDAPVDFSAVSPSGKTYTKQNNSQYTTVTENSQTVMAIDKPEAGEWTVIPNAAYDQFKVYSMDPAPVVMFEKPASVETDTDIRLLLNDFSDSLTVTLFYNTNRTDFNGIPITEITGFHDAILDYQWNTQNLPSGDYYIYCRVDNGNSTPVLLYAPGVIEVNNGNIFNTIPQNLKYKMANDTVVVSWDTPNDKQINYATVYYKDDKAGTVLGQSCDGDSTSVLLDRLIPGMRYQVWATYTDTLGEESGISNIVEFTYLMSGNNPPYISSNDDYWVFTEDQATKVDLNTYDADGDNLTLKVLENISNYQLTQNSFTWTPSANDLSLDMLHIVVSDGIATDTLQQKIRFTSNNNQDISASFSSSILYNATFGFVNIKNSFLTSSDVEKIIIQNKRTGYKILLPCDKVSDGVFMGKIVLTQDKNSFIPVQEGDTIELNYQYNDNTYTDYAIYSSAVTNGFGLDPNYIASLNGGQYYYDGTGIKLVNHSDPNMFIYPNPNNGTFYIHCEALKNIASYRVSIFDLQGKLIYNTQDICQGDNLHRKISIPKVAKGNYLVKLVVVDNTGKNIYSNSQKIMVR